MRNDLPISGKKKFKYSITFTSWDEESLEMGETDNRGYEIQDDIDTIGDILYKANTTYGIYMPVSFGTWESTEPEEDRDFFEKGIRKYYALHLTNEDGTEISQEESDFISFLLSDGRYEIDKFRDYADGGNVIGSNALGNGSLITYFYFKGKKGKKSLGNNRAKSVKNTINRKADKYEMGGDASQHYHEIEYGEGGVARAKEVIMKKIGYNEESADYFVSKSEKFAIWLADAILKEELRTKNYTKEQYLESNVSSWGSINWQYGNSIRLILDWLQHPVTPKQDLKQLTFAKAEELAKEWHNDLQVLGGDIDFTEPEKNTILKTYPKNSDGVEYYWVFIPSNYCDLESSRMGHCGRTGYGNNLISLRSVKPYGKGHTINDSHITIAYGINDGIFYQVKGKKNNKPAEKYFPYIFDLIKSAIKDNNLEYSKSSNKFDENNKLIRSKSLLEFNGFGSEYGDEEDYGFDDMTNEELRELYELKPSIFNDAESIFAIYDAGVITAEELKTLKDGNQEFDSFGNQMKLYDRGIIDERPSTTFELNVSCDDVKRYLITDRDLNEDIIENVLCGDIDDYYDNWSYYYDNWQDLLGNLNEENEQKIIDEIVRITGLDKSVVEENGIEYYLNGDDENFSQEEFTNIFRVLANAQNSADTTDYYNYLYSNIKSALEELGEVHSLNDEGAKITIDVNNIMSEDYIALQMDYYEFTDIADLFEEELSRGSIDLPRLRIDDRYTPYGSREDFNDYISESDLESFAKGGSLRPKSSTSKKSKIKNMKPSQRKLAQGGNIETTGISKEDYFLVVKNWVYFTFNYPMGFVKDAFNSKHLEEKFSSSYTRYGSVGVLMSFWANLDNNNRRILALWIKNNYFNSASEKNELQSISDDNYAKIITHWNLFCFNFPYGFIQNVYGENTSHFEMKWVRAYESAGSTGAVNKFFTEMSSNNQELLTDWVYDNYKGITFAGGGDTGKGSVDKKGKIELSDGAEGRKIAKRIIVETDDAGDVVTYDLEVGLFAGRKKGYFIVEGTWDEVMEEGTEDEYTEERYFYQEGGLWIEGGKVYDYDGVYELEPKLKPLMSALNLNSSEVFADGGETQINNKNEKTMKYANGGNADENIRDNYDSLVGRIGDEFYFLDDIFKYKDGFKGATGTIVMPVNSQYYEYATSEDGILERFMDAMGEDEWLEALQLNRDDFEDEDDLTKAIEDGIYQLYSYGELQPFEDAGSDIESQMRELSEFADESKYPLFEVIGGGRIFGKDVVFDKIYNQELYDKIKQIEEFAKGGKVKTIKKRVSSIKIRAEKLLEESITYVWRSTDMGSGWYFMLENPNGGVLDTSLVLDIFDGDEYVSEYDDVEDWNSLSKADKKYYFDQYKEELLQVNYDYFKDEMMLNYLDEFIEYIQRDSDDNFAVGGSAGDNYGGQRDEIVAELKSMKGGLDNKAPYVFLKDGLIYVSAENGDNYADYYEYSIDEQLEELADKYDTYWDWETAGAIVLTPIDTFAKGGEADDDDDDDDDDEDEYASGGEMDGLKMYEGQAYLNWINGDGVEDELKTNRYIKASNEKQAEELFISRLELDTYTSRNNWSYERISIELVTDQEELEYAENRGYLSQNNNTYAGGGSIGDLPKNIEVDLYDNNEIWDFKKKKINSLEEFAGLSSKRDTAWLNKNLVHTPKFNRNGSYTLETDDNDYIIDPKINSKNQITGFEIYIIRRKSEELEYAYVLSKNLDYAIKTLKDMEQEYYDKYAEGGEVEEWMEQALASLIEETGYDMLEITIVSNDGNEFYATDENAEYRVFKTEDDAEETAIQQVREDLEENPEYFNQDWLMYYIDGRDFFEEALNEMNDSYVQDIESESDRKYANRLIAELVENGLMDEEDAESDNAEELADELKSDYVAFLTEDKLGEGNDGFDYFINNFGEEETYRMVRDNNLIDVSEASKDAVNVDGIGHFLSSYDGETLYLSDDCVAYRIN